VSYVLFDLVSIVLTVEDILRL